MPTMQCQKERQNLMGKAPAFQFYPMDWARDMEEYPLEIEGAWIRICCKLWWSESKGELTKTLEQWGRILRVDSDTARSIIDTIKVEDIGDVTERNKKITIRNRRMYRDYIDKENNRLRQQKYREKHQDNTKVTSPSSSSISSSSSSSKNKDIPAKPDSIKKTDSVYNLKWEYVDKRFHQLTDYQATPQIIGKILAWAKDVGEAVTAIYKMGGWTTKAVFMGAVRKTLRERNLWSDDNWQMVKNENVRFEKWLENKEGAKIEKLFK